LHLLRLLDHKVPGKNCLYESKLLAAEAVRSRLLRNLPSGVSDTDDTNEPVIFVDTQSGDFREKNEEDDAAGSRKGRIRSLYGESKSNEMEAALVRQHVLYARWCPVDLRYWQVFNSG
jgi:DNA polymerase alpha-associated DNA helicase A